MEKLSTRGETLVRVDRRLPFLGVHPKRAALLVELGFRGGFRIPCVSLAEVTLYHNLTSILHSPEVVTANIDREVEMGRMAGPFVVEPIQGLLGFHIGPGV